MASERSINLLRAESGFTLVELLVSMLAGAVIVITVVLILDFSKTQQTQISDHVRADQIGRTSLERILIELRSGCVGGMPPIQGPIASLGGGTPVSPLQKLNGENLWFVSTYGTAEPGKSTLKEGYLHDVKWEETSPRSNTNQRVGTLTDYMFKVEKGELPQKKWEFQSSLSPATATRKHVLARNVTPLEGTTVFRYFRFDTTTTDAKFGELIEMKSSELPPTTEEAESRVAQVRVEYQQAPESLPNLPANTSRGHTTTVSGAVNLRLTPGESTEEGTTTCT
jgi:Prokaryotic N-terminal methylation motif